MMTTKPQTQCASQTGFTLVEILVTMLLSLVLLAGILQIFASNQASFRVHDSISQMQDNSRFAMETITRDVRMADFWGCADNVSKVVNGLDPGGGAGYIDYTAGGIAGTDGGGPGVSDTLVLRGAFGGDLNVQSPFGPQSSANIKVATNNGLAVADILLVSDCESADVFQLTSGNPDGTGTLVHNTGVPGVTPGNLSPVACTGGNAHCLSKVYDNDAFVLRLQQVTYSIGVGASGEPALLRNGQELVDGIEEFQVLYGEDTDASGTANYYVDASQVTDMENVVSLRIALVARSWRNNISPNNQSYSIWGVNTVAADNRLRQVYSTTIGVRNRLP